MENFLEYRLSENFLEMLMLFKDCFRYWMYGQVWKLYNIKVKQNKLVLRFEMEI